MPDIEFLKKIRTFLQQNHLMVMATSSKVGQPHASTMLYALDESFNLYFSTRVNTQKYKNLSENPNVGIVIGLKDELNIHIHGEVQVIQDSQEIDKALEVLAKSAVDIGDFWPPIIQIKGSDYAIFKLIPNWVRALDASSKKVNVDDSLLSMVDLSDLAKLPKKEEGAKSGELSGKTVLVAEDDQFIKKMTKMQLQKLNLNVLEVADGESTVKVMREKKPDLLLLDIVLPLKDGFEVLDELAADAALAQIPVIILSKLGQDGDKERALQKGAKYYFSKFDVDGPKIVEMINKFL